MMKNKNETSAVITGQIKGRIWYGRFNDIKIGTPVSVDFGWQWAMDREERKKDVIGFYHTHPFGAAIPSARDIRTMRAWVSSLGKPLMCMIEDNDEIMAYLFETDEDTGTPFVEIQRFPRKIIIGVKG